MNKMQTSINAFLIGVVIALACWASKTNVKIADLQRQINAQDEMTAEHVRNLYKEIRK